MSTYYSFHRLRCGVIGGHMTCQAWGVGNADLVDTFKFVMHHATTCGHENVRLVSEHDGAACMLPDTSVNRSARLVHLRETMGIFPHSDDWSFMAERMDRKAADVELAWVERERAAIEDEEEWSGADLRNGSRPAGVAQRYAERLPSGWWGDE